MGRPQYSSPEAGAIASIDESVADLEIVVDELKNTDVANIATELADLGTEIENVNANIATELADLGTEIENVNFWDVYTPISKRIRNTKESTPTSEFSISGEGYISKLIILSHFACNASIYIDGDLKMTLKMQNSSGDNMLGGMCTKDYIFDDNSDSDLYINNFKPSDGTSEPYRSNIDSFITTDDEPYIQPTADTDSYILELAKSRFFNSNVEVLIDDAGGSGSYFGIIFEGGVK